MPTSPLPILLLHGALGSGAQMRRLGDALRHERAVLEPDLPGHGRRSGTGSDFSIGRFSDDVCTFLDRQDVGAADVFGYSMGGYVGLHLARHHPGRVGSIMTLGTKFAWDEPTARKEASRLDPEALESKAPAFAARLREWHGPAWTQVVRSTAHMMLGLGVSPALTGPDFVSIRNRALVAVGDRDAMVSVGETLDAYRLLPEGAFLVLPGTPHPFDQVDAGALLNHVRHFFSMGKASDQVPVAGARENA